MDFYYLSESVNHRDYIHIGGIYKIENLCNGKFYLGRSENLSHRYITHKHGLNRAKQQHKTSVLRQAWLKYGGDQFRFVVLETVENNDKLCLPALEQKYLDYLTPWLRHIGYNIDKTSVGFVSDTASRAMKKQIDAGRKFSGKHSTNAHLTEEQVIEIRNRYRHERLSSELIAHEYGVSKNTICRVISGQSWKDTEGHVKTQDMPKRSHMTLNEDQRKDIARLYETGNYTYCNLAQMFSCSRNMVNRAIRFYRNYLS